jgi:Flp pilus assembly CpaE family ATPase
LVTQVSVVELRNSYRIIKAFFGSEPSGKLEIILNRYTTRSADIDELSISKALVLSSLDTAWKIPNDFQAVRSAQNTATALSLKDNPVTRALLGIARSACGKTAPAESKKRRFSLFGKG